MSTRVTIAAGPQTGAHTPARIDWHVFRDVLDEDGRVHVEMRGLLELASGALAGGAPWVELSLPAAAWWAMVRAVAEARALGQDRGEGLPSRTTDEGVLDPSWAALTEDAGTEELRAVAQLARERASEVAWLRSAVERALRDGGSVLAVACADALRWSLPPADRRDAMHDPTRGREIAAQGSEIARLIRVTLSTDAGGIRWLLSRWSRRMRCTALEVLRRGEVAELRRLLDETAAEADAFA